MERPPAPDDHRAYVEQLFRAQAGFVASFLARLGVAQADLDDAVQEVFTVAYRKGAFHPDRATARSWLGAIAARVASGLRRRAHFRRERLEAEPAATVASDVTSALSRLELRESLDRVARALDSLDLPLRTVFVLFELEGEDCSAIAGALELPVGTVYSRLHTARKRFTAAHQALLDTHPLPIQAGELP
ncbi:MAG: RNA polymerase sigma factor [Polyangiales bacterium]